MYELRVEVGMMESMREEWQTTAKKIGVGDCC